MILEKKDPFMTKPPASFPLVCIVIIFFERETQRNRKEVPLMMRPLASLYLVCSRIPLFYKEKHR